MAPKAPPPPSAEASAETMAVMSPSAEASAETVAVVAFGALMEAMAPVAYSELWRGHPRLQQWRLHRESGHSMALMLLHPGAEQPGTDNFGELVKACLRGTSVIRMTRRVGGGGPAAVTIEDKNHGIAACAKLGPK